ncbi:DUF2268 domain-containing protein [Guptibacillus algicola]|uniref:DUF2268 domain-containing protein n=1 Tax=Guptibacillus algicola TaxID=225844 RepID=UPI001CD34760|nr:DUF2268 domain-containing putative Zn-dependent protease [Alkalihalobacillus algicola]MCA0987391.1 DUF2268 domain-containing protein [Alkalihalobacillus algicola]
MQRTLKLPIKLLVVVSAFLLLISCSNEKATSEISTEFQHKDQTFHIVPLHEYVLDYTNKVKGNPDQNNNSEYFSKVTELFQSYAANHDVSIAHTYTPYFQPTSQVEKLEENTVELVNNQDKINELIEGALIKAANNLSGGNKTIFVMPLNPENTFPVRKMEGVSAFTLSEDAILVQLDPSFIEEALEYTIAHEYHHTIHMEKEQNASYTLLDSIVFEGKADYFARMLYPDKEVPWNEPIPERSLENVIDEVKQHASSTSATTYSEFLYGNPAKDIPVWSIYKLGYPIMKSYIENTPDISVENWSDKNTTEIITDSDYSQLLNES